MKISTASSLSRARLQQDEIAALSIHYHILADIDRLKLYIAITRNDSGGYFSRELVPISKVEACLAKYEADTPFPSKALKEAFVGLSSNNAGFLAAILRSEGVLGAAPDSETQHVVTCGSGCNKGSSHAIHRALF